MGKLSEEEAARKKAIFEGMSPKAQARILKKGYDQWDPFMPPNDPIDLRKGQLNRTALELTRTFLAGWDSSQYSNAFGEGAWEMCKGLINEDERYMGMYAFALWYAKELEKEKK